MTKTKNTKTKNQQLQENQELFKKLLSIMEEYEKRNDADGFFNAGQALLATLKRIEALENDIKNY